jgi:hypothetical protein
MINISTILIVAFLIEIITLFGRFFFKLSSKKIYIKLMQKFGLKSFVHFHHSFFGLILSFFSFYYGLTFLFNLGLGMILSDLFHHFVILWSIVGNPEFHIFYKNPKYFQKEKELEDTRIKRFVRHIIHIFE